MKRTLRLFLTLCVSALSMTLLQAQERTYTGTVSMAEDGSPIIGANVQIVGTNQGTSTGIDGTFSVRARAGGQLRFSYLGMEPQIITLGNSTVINVILASDAASLDEVVVTAYGSSRRKDLTGAVSSIDSKVIAQQQLASVSRAFEGAFAGVRTSSITGQPGTDAKIVIRGLGSVDASVGAEALIVVDGVPMYNTATWNDATTATAFSSINPNDIESISVSKDAASNALYGSRGANGVVFVTTKKGRAGKARVSLEARFGINQQGVPDMAMIKDPQEYYEYAWTTIYNRYRYMGGEVANTVTPNINNPVMSHQEAALRASQNLFTQSGTELAASGNLIGNYSNFRVPTGEYLIDPNTGKLNSNAELLYYDDWNDFFIQNRFRQEYNVNIQGGSDKHAYYVSLGYLSDPSYIVRSKFERYSVRASLNSQLTKWLTSDLQVNYSLRKTEFQNNSDNAGTVNTNIFAFKDMFCPVWALYAHDLDGNIKTDDYGDPLFDLGTGQTDSPYGATKRGSFSGYSPGIYVTKDRRFKGADNLGVRGELVGTFLRDFKVTANMSMNNEYTNDLTYGNNVSGSAARDSQGTLSKAFGKSMAITSQQLVSWNKSFGLHNITAMVGHEYWWLETNDMNAAWKMMLIPYFVSSYNTTTFTDAKSNVQRNATEGYFARANYNYDQRYLLSASIRRDGTSKFDKNKWGTFWSVGGAWRISQESFMENASWVTDLKLRTSYGLMGNANINNVSPSITLWTISNTGTQPDPKMGIAQGTPARSDLTWETNKQLDIGLDFRLWNRFYGSLDYFRRVTDDMIWNRPFAISTGSEKRYENVGSLLNYGFEVEMGVTIIDRPNLRWNFDANVSFLRNRLLSIPMGVGSDLYNGAYTESNYLRGVGKDWYNLFLYKYAGVDPETGLGLCYKELTEADIKSGRWTGHEAGDIVTTDNMDSGSWDDPTRFELGSTSPKAIGGFSTNITWKNWDFGLICSYQIGGKFVSLIYQGLTGTSLARGFHKDVLDAWSPSNTDGYLPMRFNGATNYGSNPAGAAAGQYSDLSVFDASYLNIRSITLGYNLPKQLMDRWGMSNIRVYASVDNAFLWTVKKGLDPRYGMDGGTGVGAWTYPQVRSMSLGINISF